MPGDLCRIRNSRNGLTLVELLVVLAIVMIAFATVIPVVSKARSAAKGVMCEANLHTIYSAIVPYTLEFSDHYPFGFIFEKQNPNNGRPVAGTSSYITWFSSFDRYLTSGAGFVIPLNGNSQYLDGSTTRVFSSVFRCPTVPPEFRQQVTYYQHGVVMPHMPMELGLTPPGRVKVTSPATIKQVYPNTALIWDTHCWVQASPQTPLLFWGSIGETTTGYAAFCTYIDDFGLTGGNFFGGPLLHEPQYPERRYRSPGQDRFSASTNDLKNPAGPIAWLSDHSMQSAGFNSLNSDSTDGTLFDPGNARFRHPNLGCNVLFADGSVQTLYLHPERKVSNGQTGHALAIDSDFRRYMLMIKWPNNGIVDSGNFPTD